MFENDREEAVVSRLLVGLHLKQSGLMRIDQIVRQMKEKIFERVERQVGDDGRRRSGHRVKAAR